MVLVPFAIRQTKRSACSSVPVLSLDEGIKPEFGDIGVEKGPHESEGAFVVNVLRDPSLVKTRIESQKEVISNSVVKPIRNVEDLLDPLLYVVCHTKTD